MTFMSLSKLESYLCYMCPNKWEKLLYVFKKNRKKKNYFHVSQQIGKSYMCPNFLGQYFIFMCLRKNGKIYFLLCVSKKKQEK